MKRSEIKNLYIENGIYDLKLRNTEDLFKVHGIDFKDVEGYNKLDEVHRTIYEEFIVKMFNSWGIKARSTIVPKGIYLIDDVQYLIEENPKDDYYIVCGKNTSSLLFKYDCQERSEWLRVIQDDDNLVLI